MTTEAAGHHSTRPAPPLVSRASTQHGAHDCTPPNDAQCIPTVHAHRQHSQPNPCVWMRPAALHMHAIRATSRCHRAESPLKARGGGGCVARPYGLSEEVLGARGCMKWHKQSILPPSRVRAWPAHHRCTASSEQSCAKQTTRTQLTKSPTHECGGLSATSSRACIPCMRQVSAKSSD